MLEEGDKIGEYTLTSYLGDGSYGEVWKASKKTTFLEMEYAIKFLYPRKDGLDFDKVRKEAETWKKVSGLSNIISVIEANNFRNWVYIVSEYAEGGSLADWLEKEGGKASSFADAIEIMNGVLKGLENIHEQAKIIHRDIKLENILLKRGVPCLADFGVSREIGISSNTSFARGTEHYMPPEAFEGKITIGADIWAAGIIFQELLTGNHPFIDRKEGKITSGLIVIDLIKSALPEPLPESIPLRLREIIGRALEKDRTKRFQSAREMRKTLKTAWENLRSPKLQGTVDDEAWHQQEKLKRETEAEKKHLRQKVEEQEKEELEELTNWYRRVEIEQLTIVVPNPRVLRLENLLGKNKFDDLTREIKLECQNLRTETRKKIAKENKVKIETNEKTRIEESRKRQNEASRQIEIEKARLLKEIEEKRNQDELERKQKEAVESQQREIEEKQFEEEKIRWHKLAEEERKKIEIEEGKRLEAEKHKKSAIEQQKREKAKKDKLQRVEEQKKKEELKRQQKLKRWETVKFWIELPIILPLWVILFPIIEIRNAWKDREYHILFAYTGGTLLFFLVLLAPVLMIIELTDSSLTAFESGASCYEKKDYDCAISNLTEAIKLKPEYTKAYFYRGNSYNNRTEYDKAIVDYSRAIELEPQNANVYKNRGIAYSNKGDYEQAIINYNKAIELLPGEASTYVNRGNAYRTKKNNEQAIIDYSKAIEINPNNVSAYDNRATAYWFKDDYDKAVADHSKLIELNPNNAGNYYSRGFMYRLKKENDQAIADYTKAIELEPKNPIYYRSRAIALENVKNLSQAQADRKKADDLEGKK